MASADASLPQLATGQQLTRKEFHRRYEAMPDLKKAELIEGVVLVHGRVTHREGSARAELIGWSGYYTAFTPHTEGAAHATVRLDAINEPQPDSLIRITSACGGQARIDEDDYIAGAPELAVAVSVGRTEIDLGPRRKAYRRNGVQEYVVWRVDYRTIDWFVLRSGQYERLPLTEGIYRSEVFPGLWLDPAALTSNDLAAVLRVLHQGLASAEHAAFVARLEQGTPGGP